MSNNSNGMKASGIIEILEGYEDYIVKFKFTDQRKADPFPEIRSYVVEDDGFNALIDVCPSEKIVSLSLERHAYKEEE